MILKNTMNDIRQLRVDGQIVEVGPMKTIEINSTKVIYDNVVFKLIDTKKEMNRLKSRIIKRGLKNNDSSKRTGCIHRDILNHY